MSDDIGRNLKTLRKKVGLSGEKLGQLVGCNKSKISKLENNEQAMTIEWAKKLAPHLRVKPHELLPNLNDQNPKGDKTIYDDLTQLGEKTPLPQNPDEATLERVPNPQKDVGYNVRFTAPEFTSICPITGAPDFAHLMIDYVPGDWLVESKSLKLFLGAFRNHGAFHEDCTVMIARRIVDAIAPEWLRIGGYWYPRGGIPIDVFYQTGKPPEEVWIPDQNVANYRGRG